MENSILIRFKKNQFLFEELVKRDFKQKYKRTILGMAWSLISPLLTLLVLKLVFSHYFGRSIPHYVIYLFCGNLVFSYFREATTGGMNALMANAHIFTRINVPKYIFLLSKNVSALINFGLTLCIFFVFVLYEGIDIKPLFLALLFPILCIVIFNIGIGMILSALFVFFRDIGYLYEVFTMLLMYTSAIFYEVSIVPVQYQNLFYLNPIYCYIYYFREIVLIDRIPSLTFHLLSVFYALLSLVIGMIVYKKNNHKFLYYV